MMIIIGAVWWVIGAASFVYWWTREYDFTLVHILAVLIIGWLGPVGWIIGRLMHGEQVEPIVLIKARGKR